MSATIKNIPAARWDIWETAAWIETRDFAEVGCGHNRVPARDTIYLIANAWRGGEICPSGEIDGAGRRSLTSEDAADYSIELYTHEGEDCGALGILYRKPHHVLPHLYAPDELMPEGSSLVVVKSLRTYPEELVHERYGDTITYPGESKRMRNRFISGLLFDRGSVIAKWPAASGGVNIVLNSDAEIFERSGFRQIGQLVCEHDIDLGLFDGHLSGFVDDIHVWWNENAKRKAKGFSLIEGNAPRETLRGQCRRFHMHFRAQGVRKISIVSNP